MEVAFTVVSLSPLNRFIPLPSTSFEILEVAQSILTRCEQGILASKYSLENQSPSKDHLYFNCYGFIGELLKESSLPSYETIVQFMYKNRSEELPVSVDGIPCPFHYAAFFTSLVMHPNNYWESVQDWQSLQPGDFIVYLPLHYKPKEIIKIQNRKTGTHVMLIEQIIQINQTEIKLVIIDCTRAPHCSEDHRADRGIGRSPLNISVQGEKTSIQWGKNLEKLEKDLFFGRLKS